MALLDTLNDILIGRVSYVTGVSEYELRANQQFLDMLNDTGDDELDIEPYTLEEIIDWVFEQQFEGTFTDTDNN